MKKNQVNGVKIKQSETLRFEASPSVEDMVARMLREEKGYNDFCNLEKLVSACAREAIDLLFVSHPSRNYFIKQPNVDDEMIRDLVECYRRSHFNFLGNKAYSDFVKKQVKEFAEDVLRLKCVDQHHFDLVLPVMFYLVVLNHESNAGTVERRRRSLLSEGWDNVSWQTKSNFSILISNFSDMLDKIRVAIPKDILSETKRFKDVLSSIQDGAKGKKHIKKTLTVVKPITSKVDMIEQLSEIEFFSMTSNLGLFLLDILRATHDKNRPMDTLLRLYMLVHIDKRFFVMLRYVSAETKELIQWHYCDRPLLNYFAHVEKESYIYPSEDFPLSCQKGKDIDNFLMNEFVEAKKNNKSNNFTRYVSFSDEKPKKSKRQRVEDYRKLYNYLTETEKDPDSKENEIRPKHVILDRYGLGGLVLYFLNEDIMKSYAPLKKDIESFMDGMQRLMELVPTLSKVYTIEKSISNLEAKREAEQLDRRIKEDLEYFDRANKEEIDNL